MATSTSPRAAGLSIRRDSNVVPLRSARSSTSIMRPVGNRAAPRRRPASHATPSHWGWMEAAILSASSWLGSFLVEGLIHCAFANYAGDPKLIQQILDARKAAANAEIRRSVQETRP